VAGEACERKLARMATNVPYRHHAIIAAGRRTRARPGG
jgi:hypothetical protein